MTPIQSQALDLLARIFIWTIRLSIVGFGLIFFFAMIGYLTR
ncbi:hypothetical protein At1D1108_49800 (plasmid) [Agrobacterium tumefaciens]|nr:hypothetical protein At1D1108_49800 [Agrobacterium tumefaciens]